MAKINYTKEFEAFFKLYPHRWNHRVSLWVKNDKAGAFKEWKLLSVQERKLATEKAPTIEKGEFTPDARKWLKHKMWENESIGGPPPSKLPTLEEFNKQQQGKLTEKQARENAGI